MWLVGLRIVISHVFFHIFYREACCWFNFFSVGRVVNVIILFSWLAYYILIVFIFLFCFAACFCSLDSLSIAFFFYLFSFLLFCTLITLFWSWFLGFGLFILGVWLSRFRLVLGVCTTVLKVVATVFKVCYTCFLWLFAGLMFCLCCFYCC